MEHPLHSSNSVEDDPLMLRGLAEQCLVGVSDRAVVVVVYVDNGLVCQFPGASTAQASSLVLQSTR